MVTLELTPEEFYMLVHIIERTKKQRERRRVESNWIKQNGFLVHKSTGRKLDLSNNRFVN